jgi:hypothetical protein
MAMYLDITPEPTEEERAAIEAALARESEAPRPSPWADALLPQRDGDPEP